MGAGNSKDGQIKPKLAPKSDKDFDQIPDTKDDLDEEALENPLGRKLMDPSARFRKAISQKLSGMKVRIK